MEPKAVCICFYTAEKDKHGQTYLVRKHEVKCQMHGSREMQS